MWSARSQFGDLADLFEFRGRVLKLSTPKVISCVNHRGRAQLENAPELKEVCKVPDSMGLYSKVSARVLLYPN